MLEDLETDFSRNLSFPPLFFYRYVDDIITCVHDIGQMLEIFNSYEQRLQFTHEVLKNNAVYKVDCVSCEFSNVVQTKRCFKKRKSEHKTQKFSAILQQIWRVSKKIQQGLAICITLYYINLKIQILTIIYTSSSVCI